MVGEKTPKSDTATRILQQALGDNTVTVFCGANQVRLEDAGSLTVREVRRRMREILNIGADHVAFVDGHSVADENRVLSDVSEIEFKKPSGEKG